MNSIISINKIHLLQKELNPFLIKFVFSENRAEIELGNSIYWTDFEFRIQNTDYFWIAKRMKILETNQMNPNQLLERTEKGLVSDILLENMFVISFFISLL